MDKIEEKRQLAASLFKKGYNCSQAVLCAFAKELGLDEKTAFMIASSFGGGMGRMREVCGACSGMFMAAGLKYGDYDPLDNKLKAEHYKRIQDLAEQFKMKNGSIICRELLALGDKAESHVPEQRTEAYYKKRPCGELVADAAEIFANVLYKA